MRVTRFQLYCQLLHSYTLLATFNKTHFTETPLRLFLIFQKYVCILLNIVAMAL